jgi:hypothetical protein
VRANVNYALLNDLGDSIKLIGIWDAGEQNHLIYAQIGKRLDGALDLLRRMQDPLGHQLGSWAEVCIVIQHIRAK